MITLYVILILLGLAFFPVLGLFLSLPLYFVAKKKITILSSSILVGLLVGFFAFNFLPKPEFDLARHHNVVRYYSNYSSINEFFDVSENVQIEIIPQMISFMVSKFDNPDFLQLICVAIGYSSLFYILSDYRNKTGLNMKMFIPLFILGLFGQPTLYYFSGLYNYLAINLFALAFYLDYKKGSRILAYIIYFMLPLLHSSMIFPLSLLILFKMFGSKLSRKMIVVTVLASIMVTGILGFLVDVVGVSSLGYIRTVLDEYFMKNDSMQKYYSGIGFFIDLAKAILVIGVSIYSLTNKPKNKNGEKESAFLIILLISTFIMMMRSIVIIRFISLALFIAIPLIIDILVKNNRQSKILFYVVTILAVLFAIYNIHSIYPYGYNTMTAEVLLQTWEKVFIHI